ncbi:MAG: hypothetical protein IT185_07735, partial [Acidobacteria bacterium]|nr:hypothetical protein [Acidobacteriota bacterium]
MIPELPPGDADAVPDLRVVTGPVPTRLDAPTIRGALYEADSRHCLVTAPGVARYLVEGGTLIRIDAQDG